MNKTTLALALGAGLALGLAAAPKAHAAGMSSTTPLFQTLATRDLTAGQFNSLFAPIAGKDALQSNLTLDGVTGTAGTINSQVFQGAAGSAAAGTYAYAYQIKLNDVKDANGNPVQVDSAAFKFNSTPLGTDFTHAGTPAYSYLVRDAAIGGLNLPGSQAPSNLSWSPGSTSGAIRAMYADPANQVAPINAASTSATFVLVSNQVPSDVKPSVNIGSTVATTSVPTVYSSNTGTIEPIPVPEPATILAWSGMVAAFAMVRQVRKTRRLAIA